jgi:hypothetical protein
VESTKARHKGREEEAMSAISGVSTVRNKLARRALRGSIFLNDKDTKAPSSFSWCLGALVVRLFGEGSML